MGNIYKRNKIVLNPTDPYPKVIDGERYRRCETHTEVDGRAETFYALGVL